MAGKYWWEEDDQTKEQSDGQTSTQDTKSQGYWWENGSIATTVGNNVTNRVNTWLKNHNGFISDYQKRYEGRKYNYEDSYVSDSSSWLESVKKQKSDSDAEYENIISYIDQNKNYLDEDWITEIKNTLSNARHGQYRIVNGATKDNEYWSMFTPNEDQTAAGYTSDKIYEQWQAEQKQYAEDQAFDVEAATLELEELKKGRAAYIEDQEEKRKKAQSEESFWDSLGRWLGTTPDTTIPLAGVSVTSDSYIPAEKYDKRIADLEERIERSKYVQGYESYMKNMDAIDYVDSSQYVSTRTDVAKEDALWGLYNNQYDTSKLFGDFLYDYINGNQDALDVAMVNDTVSDAYFYGFDKSFLKTLTKEEVGVFNSIYKNESPEAAYEFIKFVESDLKGRKRAQEQAFWAGYAKEDPVGSSVFSTLISPLKGLSYLGQAADMLDDGKMEQNARYNRFSYIPSSIRSQVSTTIENSGKWGKVGSFAYNTGMSMADFLFTTAVSGGNQGLSLAIMGTGAAADATLAAKDRGLDDGEAFALGTIAGLAEVAMEKISLAAWLEGDMTDGALKYVLKNALTEGGEEAGTSVINLLADVIISGDKSEWNVAMQAYIDQGKSPEEAFGLVAAEQAAQIGLDALGGMLSGAAIGGGTYAGASVASQFKYGDTAKNKVSAQKLVTEGLELNPDSQYIQKAKTKLDNGKNLTGMQVRNILAANQDQITENDIKKIQKAAEARLTELGQTKDVQKVAEIATKRATGQTLTRAEKSFLANSQYGARVANELLPENIMSDDYSTEWAEGIGTKQVNKLTYNIKNILAEMTKMNNPATYKSLEERVSEDDNLNVSESGTATISKTNEAIDLSKPEIVDFVRDKETGAVTDMILNVDGKQVKASEIDFADADQSYLFSAVKKIENITPGDATAFVRDYKSDSGQTVGEYLNGIDEAYTYGFHNYSEADMGAGLFTPKLSSEQAKGAYLLGQATRSKSDTNKSEAIKRMRTAVEAEAEKAAAEGKKAPKAKKLTITYNEGGGKIKSFDKSGIVPTEKQGAGVEVAKILHKLGLGTNFEFFASKESDTLTVKDKKTGEVKKARVFINDAGVEEIAPAGVYRKSDGTIRIDLNAYNGRELTLNALAHELTHFIQQWSDTKYKVLVDFLMKTYEKTDMTMHQRVLAEQARLKDIRGEDVSYNEAYDEVVAKAMMKMFNDGRLVERLTELKAQDKDLAHKLWERFKEILAEFLGFYNSNDRLYKDSDDLVGMKDAFEQLQNMFAEALVEASENFQTSLIAKEAGLDIMPVEDGVQYSYSSLAEAAGFTAVENEDGTRFFTREGKKVSKVTVEDIDNSPIGAFINFSLEMGDISKADADRQKQMFADICTMASKTNDFAMTMQFVGSAVFTGMKANADKQYGTTYDFPSICTKTQAVIDAMSAKMVSLGRGLNTKEIVQLYDDVFASGNPVPCPECYVFSRWIGIGGLLDNIKKYQDYYGNMNVKDVAAAYLEMKEKVSKFAEEQGISFGKAKGALTSKLTKEFNKLTEKIEKAQNQGEKVKASDKQRLAELEPMMNTVKSMTWLENVYFADSSLKKVNPNFRVPDSVLFDLNNGEAFATKYKEAWAFRTTQGAGYGKAITPYAEARLGEGVLVTNNTTNTIKGRAQGTLDNYFLQQMGKLDKKSRDALKRARLKQKIQAFIGGQRFQSTSDARYENASDYLLAALEMQAMRGMVQVYTKVDGAVPAFSAWGFSINQSLMPLSGGLDADGNVKDTAVGGMKPEVAFENRNKHESAGTITIGVNDNHIRAMFKQLVRDFIIPYHASGGKADTIAEFRRIQEDKDAKGEAVRSTDYSRTQSDKVLSDEVLRWQGKTDAQIQRIHEIRNARIAILTGGNPNMTVVRSNRFLSALYDKLNGGEWDGVKLAKSKVESQIYPNEFWDQTVTYEESGKITKDYLEYCEDLGFLHRFSGMIPSNGKLVPANGYDQNGNRVQLTDLAYQYDENGNKTDKVEDFFWKVLTDRRMYDNNGNYLAQKIVTLNDTTTDTVTGFAKNNQGREYDKAKAEALTKKILDNSSSGRENNLTNKQGRGEANDNRGIRKGTAETTGDFQTDGRRYSESVGAAQEENSFGDLSTATRKRITNIVNNHIADSQKYDDIIDLLCLIANKSADEMTDAQLKKSIRQISETIYADAMTMPSLLFEDRWSILGGANKLRNDIIAATKTKPSGGEKNLDSDGRQVTKGQQEFFKDTKVVDKNGKLLVMYHGSSSNIRFTVFELRSMVNGRIYGEGYYFTEDKNEALNWGGGQLYEVYVNLSNPYYASTQTEAPEAIVALAKENYGRTYDRLSQDPNWWGSKYTREEYIEQNSRMWENAEIALNSAIDTSDIPEKGFSEELARRKTKLLKSLKYDGVIVSTSKSNRNFQEVVAFDSNQIKLTANKNPTKNIDMQFSSQETDADVGYHAGDLGKSESLRQQGLGRDTGHFGTGTYFVGNKASIEGYNSRNGNPAPVETVDFNKYNLFKPKDAHDGFVLHDFLRGVDGYWNRDVDAVNTMEEYESLQEKLSELVYDIEREEFGETDPNKESWIAVEKEFLSNAKRMMGDYKVGTALTDTLDRLTDGNYQYDAMTGEYYSYDFDTNQFTSYTEEEIIQMLNAEEGGWKAYEGIEKLADDYYSYSRTSRYENWSESIKDVATVFGISEQQVRNVFQSVTEDIKSSGYTDADMETADSAATRFMKALGYEGIDVRGIKGLDNTRYGSVIYDLKGEDLARKKTIGTARYSTQETDNISNRDLLANAFEWVVQNSEEYKLIQEYKGHIKILNEYEEKLSELNAEIRKMTFGTEGVRDSKKLKELQAKAKEVAKNINRHDMKLLSLEASEPLRKVIEQERKKEAQKTKDHVKELLKNKKARAEQTEIRHKIRKAVRDLDKLLNRGNKKTNVKEDMRGVVSKALELADYIFTDHISNDELIRRGITVRMTDRESALVKETEDILTQLYDNADNLTNEEFTRLDAKRKSNLEKLRDLLKAQRNESLNTPVYNLFNDLVTEYASLKNSSQESVKAAYNEELENSLRAFISDDDRVKILKNMRVADMTTEELNWLYRAYTMVLTNVRNANKFHVSGMNATIEQVVGQIAGDFSSRKIPDKKLAIAVQKLVNKLGWDYEKLHYALDRIGSEAFTKLIMNIADSENTVMQDVMEAAAFRDKIVENYGFNNWDVNKEIDREFLDSTGKKFKMTLGQLMSLYAYSRRDGAWDHIEYGGFVFGDAALTNPRPADSYKLSKEQCEAITNLLTKEQKGYVEDMQKFLSETMGAKGNEVSMLLYGIKMFGEKNYFPIHIAGQFKAQAQESQAKAAAGFSSMSNAGFTHAQNPNAKAPFVLEGFNEIWADHVNEMSRYHGTVPALEDLRRVMNRSTYSDAVSESQSIKQLMENSYGKEAVQYFDKLYREANSGAIQDRLQIVPKKLLSLFRKNSVAYSLSVVIQQPSAMARAYAMIDKKYFGFKGFGALTSGVAKAVSSKWNPAYANAYNEMLKYAPGVTMAKEIGGFDTHTGTSIREYLLDTGKSFKQSMKTENLAGKGKALMGLVDDNAIANLPTVADKIAWIEIWNACKRETVAKHKDLATNSEEFMKIVGERFTEVIRATQVYDSMFSKSPMLKSKNLAVQYLVSFMNEPNTTANMVEKAVRDAVKGDWKSGVRMAAAVTYSIIFNNVLKAIVYAMRDDDEDEAYIEKYLAAVAGGIVNDFNPLSYIPLVKDAWSKAQGYDVERPDVAIIADAIEAIQSKVKYDSKDLENMTEEQIADLEKKIADENWKLVGSLAAFFGIPVKNIYREIEGVIDHARIASANAGMATLSSVWDKVTEEVLGSIPFMQSGNTKQDKLYETIMSGDKEYLARLKNTYKDDSAYQSAVRKALRENDSRIHDAAQARYDGNTEEYKRIFREIQKEGKFTFDDIMSAINSEENAIKNKLEPDKATSEYSASDYVEALAMGYTSNADAMREDIIATKVANGKTQAEAEKEFISNVATGIRDAYASGLLDEAGAEKMLMEYADKDEDEAVSKVSYWSFIEEHKEYKDDLSESNVKDYKEFAEPAEIPLDVFVQYINGTKGLVTKKDEWGDVEETKREQVLEVIDSLPLTWEQKDALYLAAGYSESKIWDVPW